MVTRSAVCEAAQTHSRMLLVIPHDLREEWSDSERPGYEGLVVKAQHGSDEISRAMTV